MSRIIILPLLILFLTLNAMSQTVVTGTLLGCDGKPMSKARIILTIPGQDTSVTRIWADKDGKYSLRIDSTGIFAMWYTGVNHHDHQVALYIDKPQTIDIDVRLATQDYVDTISRPVVIGDFNHFNPATGVPMAKQSDGTFTAEIETPADSFRYEIAGITKDGTSCNGTQSDKYIYCGDGTYMSLIGTANGKASVVLDPAKLVRSERPLEVTFADPQSFEAKFARIHDEMLNHFSEFNKAYSAFKKSGKDFKSFSYDWTGVTRSVMAELGKETDPILRQELYLTYFSLGEMGAKIDSAIARKAFEEIPPSSRIWAFGPYVISASMEYFAHMTVAERDKYVEKVLDENPSVDVKASLLYELFMRVRLANDTTKIRSYYNLLVNEYGNTSQGRVVKARYSPDLRLTVGKPLPKFTVSSLDDSTKSFTDESFRGKYCLIDFWATWCGPCVGEMQSLHDAYKRFRDKNFIMLSVSLDVSRDVVQKFRADKWPMPWPQAYAGSGFGGKIVKDFEIVGIPHPILVDPSGTIVAMDEDLRGDRLEMTLEKFLGK